MLYFLHNCEDRFHWYSLSASIYIWYVSYTYLTVFRYKGYKLNSLLTCFQQGFIAQLVEHCTGIAEVMGSNPVEASEFFLGILSARITFTHISFLLIHFVVFRLWFLERTRRRYFFVTARCLLSLGESTGWIISVTTSRSPRNMALSSPSPSLRYRCTSGLWGPQMSRKLYD